MSILATCMARTISVYGYGRVDSSRMKIENIFTPNTFTHTGLYINLASCHVEKLHIIFTCHKIMSLVQNFVIITANKQTLQSIQPCN
jgi:hypothetical protein